MRKMYRWSAWNLATGHKGLRPAKLVFALVRSGILIAAPHARQASIPVIDEYEAQLRWRPFCFLAKGVERDG